MKTRAAVLHGVGEDWKIEEVDIDPPTAGEVLVKTSYAGLCHSDEHLVSGDMVPPGEVLEMMGLASMFPIIGGHEGAGVIQEVGPGVTEFAVGDHVSVSFIPSCGSCHYCSTGRQNLCDMGAHTLAGPSISDGTYRYHLDGKDVNRLCQLGTFAEHIVCNVASVVKVDDDLPLDCVALVSCGVATGVGSAQSRAGVKSGETVVVVGIGGIGANAVQGARMNNAANIVAIDTNPDRKEKAEEFGATHFFTSIDEAMPAIMEMTHGRMADACIVTAGVVTGDMVEPALGTVGKDGTVVITGLAPIMQRDVTMDLFSLSMYNKEIKGTVFGSTNPRAEIPRLLGEYRRGALKLEELITERYSLDEINQGYADMRAGKNVRGILVFD